MITTRYDRTTDTNLANSSNIQAHQHDSYSNKSSHSSELIIWLNDFIDKHMNQYLVDTDIPMRLACLSTSNFPVVVSLWYVYNDEKFYCATQTTAKITKYLTHSQKCGFENRWGSFSILWY